MRIILFHLGKTLGGAETLMVRTAKWFTSNNYKVFIASVNSNFYQSIDDQLNFIDVSSEKCSLSDSDVVITFPIYIKSLNQYFDINGAKTIYWTVHYYNLMNFYPYISTLQMKYKFFQCVIDKFIFRNRYLKLKKLIQKNILEQNLFFMDMGVKDCVLKYYSINEDSINYDSLLPIPVTIDLHQKSSPSFSIKNSASINIGIIGRLDRFKINPSNKLFLDFLKIKDKFSHTNVVFKIIGTGKDKHLFDIPSELNVVFDGVIPYCSLLDYVSKNVDIVFAMGTTALESAVCHKPVILLDAMYAECNYEYKYKFLFETRGYSLGDLVYSETDVTGRHSLFELLSLVINDYNGIATKCYDYAVMNHSENLVFNKLSALI